MTMRLPLAVCAVALAAAIGAGSVAGASSTTSVTNVPVASAISPSTRLLIQSCLGEPFTANGDGLVVIHRTVLDDGSSIIVIHRNPQGGFLVGSVTGTVYRIGAADTTVRVDAPSGAFVTTAIFDLNVLGPGGAGGFAGHIGLHATFTPSGDLTADEEILDISCR
jgi:hypothetical protein